MSDLKEHIDSWEADDTDVTASLYRDKFGHYEFWLKSGSAMIKIEEQDIENLIELADLAISIIKRGKDDQSE